jgi:hypothetical protein
LAGCSALLQDLDRAHTIGTKVRRASPAISGHKIEPLIVSPFYWHTIVEDSQKLDHTTFTDFLKQQLEVFEKTFKKLKKGQQSIRWIQNTFLYDISISFSADMPSRHIEGVTHVELAVLQQFQKSPSLNLSDLSIFLFNIAPKILQEAIDRLEERELLVRHPNTADIYHIRQ